MIIRWKQWGVNLLVLIVSLAVVTLLLEFFLRVSGIERLTPRKPHLHQPSSIEGVHYEFIPNLKNVRGYNWERISTNALGFRGKEFDPKKPTIAVLGDSFAFGFGVNDGEENPAAIQRAFPQYNVLNMGVNGYNAEQEVQAYLGKFPTLAPSLVIVEFVFNDMEPPSVMTPRDVEPLSNYLNRDQIEKQTAQAITGTGTMRIPFKAWLATHSAIFNFIEKRTKGLSFRAHTVDNFTESITPENLAFYKTWLSTLAQRVPAAKKIFVIWTEAKLHLESRAALHAMAEQLGFTVLDLYDVFGMNYPHLSWDWHPNAAAQKTAGDLLVDMIKHYKMLP